MVKSEDTARRAEESSDPNEVRMRSAKQNQDLRSRDCISRSDMARKRLGIRLFVNNGVNYENFKIINIQYKKA